MMNEEIESGTDDDHDDYDGDESDDNDDEHCGNADKNLRSQSDPQSQS